MQAPTSRAALRAPLGCGHIRVSRLSAIIRVGESLESAGDLDQRVQSAEATHVRFGNTAHLTMKPTICALLHEVAALV